MCLGRPKISPLWLYCLQWEYDDEYDDSFDDLISYTADGVTEAEGEAGSASARGQPMRPLAGPPGPEAADTAGSAAAQRAMQGLNLGPRQQAQQGQAPGGGRGAGRKPAGKLWVLDGRIYNYPKAGAQVRTLGF